MIEVKFNFEMIIVKASIFALLATLNFLLLKVLLRRAKARDPESGVEQLRQLYESSLKYVISAAFGIGAGLLSWFSAHTFLVGELGMTSAEMVGRTNYLWTAISVGIFIHIANGVFFRSKL